MYFWNTNMLSEDIKNEKLTESDWKQYYLAGSIILSLSMYLVTLSPRPLSIPVLTEAICVVGIIIFGINITFNTNQKGNGDNYVARITALSLPIIIKLYLLSLLFGFTLIAVSNLVTPFPQIVAEWLLAIFSVVALLIYYWRINHHLRNINSR